MEPLDSTTLEVFSPSPPKPYVRYQRETGRLKEVEGDRGRQRKSQMRAIEDGREETRTGGGKLRETDQEKKKS